jgi:hypothetical protein
VQVGLALPGGQARMSGTPLPRRSRRRAHSRLTACPAPLSAVHPPWSVVGRAFGACCFAGKLRSPAPPTGEPRSPGPLVPADPYVNGYVNPYVIPYAHRVRTSTFDGRGHLSSSVPLVGPVSRTNRG